MSGRKIFIYLKRLLLLIFSMLSIVIGILHLPIIQNKIFEKLLINLSNTTGYTFTHKHFQVSWFQYTSIKDLIIKDREQKLLCQINHVNFTINPIQIVINQCIKIDHIRIDGAQLQLEYNAQGKLNLALLMQKLFAYDSFFNGTYSINKAIFQRVNCSLYNPESKLFWLYRNPDHYVYCNNIQGTLTQITTQGNLVSGKIDLLTCKTSNNPLLNDFILNTHFEISPYSLQFKELQARVAHSFMGGTFSLKSEDKILLRDITQLTSHNIKITALLKNSEFTSNDLSLFIPSLNQKNTTFKLNGKFIGTPQEFFIQNFQLQFGDKNSTLQGNGTFKKCKKNAQTIFHIFLDHGKLNAADILPYVQKTYHFYIMPFEYFTIKNSSFMSDLGNVHRHTIQGDIETLLGNIVISKMVIIPGTVKKDFTYQGSIITKDLNIGTLLRNQALGKLSMTAEIVGKEIQQAKAKLQLTSKIDKLEIYNYDYQNIHFNGIITKKQIEGSIKIRDTNLQCNSSVTISHKNNHADSALLLTGTLHHASLQPLNLLSIPIQIRTQFKLDMKHFSLKTPIGTLQLDNLCCKHNHTKEILVKKLQLCSEQYQAGLKLRLNSPLLNFLIEGNFHYSKLLNDFRKLLDLVQQDWYQLILPETTQQPYFFNYTIQLKKIMPLLKWYFPNFNLTSGIILTGFFSKGKEVGYSLNISNIPMITYKNHELLSTKLNINGIHLQDKKLRSLTIKLSAKSQKWFKGEFTTNLFSLESSLQGSQLIFQQSLMSNEKKHQFYIYGEGMLYKNLLTIRLDPTITLFKINNDLWRISPNNLLTVTKTAIQFNHFKISNNNQIIALSGTLSAQKDGVLNIEIKNLQLNKLGDLLNTKVSGTIDAVGVLRGMCHRMVFDGNARAQNIIIDNTTFGDFYVKTIWNNLQNALRINCQLYQEQKQVVELKGFYNPTKNKDNLSLLLNINAIKAVSFTPFVKDIFSDLHGTLSGDFIISGTPSQLQVDGRGIITHVILKIDYLNTSYHLHNLFTCSNQTIYFNEIKLTDSKSGTATLKGCFFYKKLEGFHIDLKGSMKNLYILNTTKKENSIFYGTNVVTGTIAFVGPLNNMVIHAKATTDQGVLTIAADKKQNTIKYGLVQFKNLKSLTKERSFSKTPTKKKSKITLLLDLNLTPSLKTIVLFNSDQGDFIKGSGNGTIKIEVGSTKPLRLTGNYRLEEGICYFSVYGFIRKVFKIQGDNQVIWNNDPYSGILNFQAAYEQEVSLLPLLEKQNLNITDAERIPVDVLLNIKGTLLTPRISFSVNFKETPVNQELRSKIDALKTKILTDKSYLDSQIFSLIAFKKFFNNDHLDLRNAVGVSMNEFISQQLHTLSSHIDKNFEIEANLGLQSWEKFKNNFLQDSKVKLSYYFLNKNLRISSGISSNAFFFNDLMITYRITTNTNIKLYSIPSKKTNSIGGGISVGFTKDFGR